MVLVLKGTRTRTTPLKQGKKVVPELVLIVPNQGDKNQLPELVPVVPEPEPVL